MTPTDIRFAADGMLQSLGTWLRLMGYDCILGQTQSSRTLLEQAVAEGRVFLTRNRHLRYDLPHRLLDRGQIVQVGAELLPEQLREVVLRYEIDTESYAFTRCTRCNAILEHTDVPVGVPQKVAARETEFWRCPNCRQVFWRGSHVDNSLTRLRQWLQD